MTKDECIELLKPHSLLARGKMSGVYDAAMSRVNLPGAWAEAGVYRGGVSAMLSTICKTRLHLFDTFNGLPPVDVRDLHKQGEFSETSERHVRLIVDAVRACDVSVHAGAIPSSFDGLGYLSFSFVHLDVDLYTSYRECLEFFFPRMVVGGAIVLDDYMAPTCPGATAAVDEFCSKTGCKVTQSDVWIIET